MTSDKGKPFARSLVPELRRIARRLVLLAFAGDEAGRTSSGEILHLFLDKASLRQRGLLLMEISGFRLREYRYSNKKRRPMPPFFQASKCPSYSATLATVVTLPSASLMV